MVRRVLIARGGSISPASGLGRAHEDLVRGLANGVITGFALKDVIQHNIGGIAPLRLWRRWKGHPAKVARSVKDVDILHITDQEHAHLVPKDCKKPVSVTVHDLFHLDPTTVDTPEGTVEIGETSPGMIRRSDLEKLLAGIARANLLICDSKTTEEHAKRLFPQAKTITVPLGLDMDSRNPNKNPQNFPAQFSSDTLNLLFIGSEEPRKRLSFAIDVLAGLPSDIRSQIVLHKVGAESDSREVRKMSEKANSVGVDLNPLGRLLETDLIGLEQHAEALLFPSVAEGFGYPPLEAMAAGCPVLMSDLGSHNELAVPGTPLDAFDKQAWIDAIIELHAIWSKRETSLRLPDEVGIARAAEFNSEVFYKRMSQAWSSMFD